MLINMIQQFIVSEEPDINRVIHDLHAKTSIRVTIIDAKGVVRYESNRDVEGMENHLNRPEIIQAMQTDIGSSVRFSESVGKDFLYVAKADKSRFIRMAYALESIQEKFFKFWMQAMGLFALAMVGAFWLAMRINRQISQDLERIDKSLDNLLKKNYVVEFDAVSCCQEFDTISKQVEKVSKKLKKRDRQKSKYTKNLKLLNKKQGDIISAISHEFKNPVAAIIGYAQTVKEDRDLSPQMREKFLEKVVKNGQKITTMIDRLSLAVKLENDNFSPTFTRFNLQSLVQDVKETLLQKYHDREIIIEMEPIMIEADRGMFDNLVTNLLDNALKYSEDEVTIAIKHGKFMVSDKGIGISKENQESITKRFFRVDTLSWDNSIGVGLYIVSYILKLHHTKLEIESELKKGSTFGFVVKDLIKNN